MPKFIDLTGKKFGRLTVIKRSYPNNKRNRVMWFCKCDCGNEKIIEADRFLNGHTRSCGCLQREFARQWRKGKPAISRLEYGLSSMRQVRIQYTKNAKKDGREWRLTDKQFKEITQKNCFYCGAKPNSVKNRSDNFGEYIYNGIDRVDNNKGYTIENVVPCCKICNYAKSNLSFPEFKAWIEKVYKKLF